MTKGKRSIGQAARAIVTKASARKDEREAEEKKHKGPLTNAKFAESNEEFKSACMRVSIVREKRGQPTHIAATSRQASKWRNEKGIAWKTMKEEN